MVWTLFANFILSLLGLKGRGIFNAEKYYESIAHPQLNIYSSANDNVKPPDSIRSNRFSQRIRRNSTASILGSQHDSIVSGHTNGTAFPFRG